MGRKIKNNEVIEAKFSALQISSNTYQTGGIYVTKDENVNFPQRTQIDNKIRLVIVIGKDEHLNNPSLPTCYCPKYRYNKF